MKLPKVWASKLKILQKFRSSKSQPLATITRHGCGQRGYKYTQDPVQPRCDTLEPYRTGRACYGELPRTSLMRTSSANLPLIRPARKVVCQTSGVADLLTNPAKHGCRQDERNTRALTVPP